MYEKLVKQGTAKFIIGAYVAMMVLVALLALIAISSEPMNVTLYNVAVWLGWLAPASHDGRVYFFACLETRIRLGRLTHLALVVVMIIVRKKVRARDAIPTAVEGDPCCEDCLCLVCCAPFAQCQVARQEYDARQYKFVSMTGMDAVGAPI